MMNVTHMCSRCGAPTLGDSPTAGLQGLCPRCVMGFAMEDAPAAPPPVPGLKTGATVGQYEIIGPVGQGGMGVVYKARHTGLNRIVALKVLSPSYVSDPEFLGRFQLEAKALAALSHPNIVAVHDAGVAGDLPYLAMEYIEGVSLRRLLAERRLPPEEAFRIVPQLCDALEYAHQHGVVHRDIKPENIMIDTAGRVKIADFGLAKMAAGGGATAVQRFTQTNIVMGTPHYMAPEQIERPTTVDHRVDIYSMGVVFYEMLTGELPIGRFALPSKKAQVHSRLDEIVMKTLEKEPAERYQRAFDVKTDLSRMDRSPAAVPAPAQSPIPLLILLSVLIAVFMGAVVLWGRGESGVGIVPVLGTIFAGVIVSAIVRAANPSAPRLSRLALWGFLCAVATYVTPLVYALQAAMPKAPAGEGVLLALIMLLLIPLGLGLSIAGWVVVARSRGALRGLGLAIAGVILSSLWFLAAPLLLLFVGARAESIPAPRPAPGIIPPPRIQQVDLIRPSLPEGFTLREVTADGEVYSISRADLDRVVAAKNLLFNGTSMSSAEGVDGVRIQVIRRDSLGAALGLKTGDTILEVNGRPTRKTEDMLEIERIGIFSEGDEVSVSYRRDGRRRRLLLKVQDAAAAPADSLKVTKILATNDSETYTVDMAEAGWTDELWDRMVSDTAIQDHVSGGLQITSLPAGSLAERFGLKANDILRFVNGGLLPDKAGVAEFRRSDEFRTAPMLIFRFERAGQPRVLAIQRVAAGKPSTLRATKIASTNDSETYTVNKAGAGWSGEILGGMASDLGVEDSASGGIQITSLPAGSLAEQVGLKVGDVLRSVNGQPLPHAGALADLRSHDALRKAHTLTFGVERAGRVRALVIRSVR